MTRCNLSPDCEFGLHAADAHPCGKPMREGDPCAYCGKPIPDPLVAACPDCWIPVTAENFRQVAAELQFDVDVARLNREEGWPS